MFKLNFWIYPKKNLIVINENIKDKKIESILNWDKIIFSSNIKFWIPYIETAPSVGIDNKKDIFAASYLLNFRNLAAVIVIPDLLTPGINDKTWKTPIIIADL